MPSTKRKDSEQLLAEDHEALDALLRALTTALDKKDAATTFARLDLFWARLAMHIRAENLHLFPALSEFLDNPASAPKELTNAARNLRQAVDKLRADHDFFMHRLADAVQLMRELLATESRSNESEGLNEVSQIVDAVRLRLASHNQLEEELVYALPARILTRESQSDLADQVRRELARLPSRFAKGVRKNVDP